MHKKKVYTIFGVFLAFGLILQFLTLPAIEKSQDTQIKLEERKAYLAERKKIIKRIEELREESGLWQDQIERLNLALPTNSQITSILFQFQNFATDSGLVMKNFDFKEQSESVSPGGAAVSVNNNFIGSYSSLKTFLKRLEKNLRIIDVQSINFSSGTKEEGEKTAEQLLPIILGVKLYYFPQK